jgi:hypothetical protein
VEGRGGDAEEDLGGIEAGVVLDGIGTGWRRR